MPTPQDPIPCLIGPTGSGKTAVGIEVARATSGEILSCDAFAAYSHMPILTAAPNAPADVPHHLVGMLNPAGHWSAARFCESADQTIAEIRERGNTPWIVGGTALYLRGWLKGFGAAVARDESLRDELRNFAAEEGPERLHERLESVDPQRSAELHPNDIRRVIRAIEIYEITGEPPSAQREEWRGPDRVSAKIFCLRREDADLDARIEARTHQMFEAGVVEEARLLLKRRLSPEAKKVLGLVTLERLMSGEIDEPEARRILTQRTRRFARKQRTFFRSFENVAFFDVAPDETPREVARRILATDAKQAIARTQA